VVLEKVERDPPVGIQSHDLTVYEGNGRGGVRRRGQYSAKRFPLLDQSVTRVESLPARQR
jgi:hypothetical protein